MVVERVGLYQVDYIEPVVFSSFGVGDTKVVPLSVAPRIIVRFQN